MMLSIRLWVVTRNQVLNSKSIDSESWHDNIGTIFDCRSPLTSLMLGFWFFYNTPLCTLWFCRVFQFQVSKGVGRSRPPLPCLSHHGPYGRSRFHALLCTAQTLLMLTLSRFIHKYLKSHAQVWLVVVYCVLVLTIWAYFTQVVQF